MQVIDEWRADLRSSIGAQRREILDPQKIVRGELKSSQRTLSILRPAVVTAERREVLQLAAGQSLELRRHMEFAVIVQDTC